jgi:hypothetical protein
MGTARESIGVGLGKLADAIHHLRAAQAEIEGAMASRQPGCDEEKLALGLTRVLNHLSEAVGDVPVEAWAEMLAAKDVGIDEIRKAMGVAA